MKAKVVANLELAPARHHFHNWGRSAITKLPLGLHEQRWATTMPDHGDTVGRSRMR